MGCARSLGQSALHLAPDDHRVERRPCNHSTRSVEIEIAGFARPDDRPAAHVLHVHPLDTATR
jgi:hypothetical protein